MHNGVKVNKAISKLVTVSTNSRIPHYENLKRQGKSKCGKKSYVGNNLRINIKGILAGSNTYLGHGNILAKTPNFAWCWPSWKMRKDSSVPNCILKAHLAFAQHNLVKYSIFWSEETEFEQLGANDVAFV